jgi:hypothetical protein
MFNIARYAVTLTNNLIFLPGSVCAKMHCNEAFSESIVFKLMGA